MKLNLRTTTVFLSKSLLLPFIILFVFVCFFVQFIRRWMMAIGGIATAVGFYLLGPVPVFHIER